MAEFGYHTIGALSEAYPTNYLFGAKFTMPANGSITMLSQYGSRTAGAGNAIAALYSDAAGVPTTLLAQSAAKAIPAADGWIDFTLTVPYNGTGGTVYWLCMYSGVDNFLVYYDTGTANQGFYSTYFVYPTIGDIPGGGVDGYNNHKFSIYATYTPAGGAVAFPHRFHPITRHRNAGRSRAWQYR